jgi:hypothetical protein
MQGIDCVGGLARCVGGRVEVSRAAIVAPHCRPETPCVCPWEQVGVCSAKCVNDGAELVLGLRLALTQLCEDAPVITFATPLDAGTASDSKACKASEVSERRCANGVVYACSEADAGEGRAVASCVHGCADESTVVDGDDALEAAVAILCRRAPLSSSPEK